MTKHKIAVITGAGSGIGLALTNEFLSRDPNMLVVSTIAIPNMLRATT